MRAMPIRIITGHNGTTQLKASFQKNYKHYLQEALGLAIFMISACFFGALLEAPASPVHQLLQNSFLRVVIMGVLMGATALFIFYSPLTAASGAQINPAVTLSFLRTRQMCKYDALFFMLFQITGGTLAVYIMQQLIGSWLIDLPVNSVVTVPGKAGVVPAAITEFIIAFITMSMVLFTSDHPVLKKYTRIFAACLVCCWVIIAGPLSGFGMNPARSFASALPANTWTSFPIYLIAPLAGMLSATEVYIRFRKTRIATN
ncbi:aquaporin [Lacibacter sp.]|uniref:aquaporin n=1 Tax=Lacibacter sp. TaxID=1915409 RepID=UPI002B4B5E5D|nr:aquaporin [Lacibacter sp.]HLP37227.1 aquaporin [Lacibacter sp.]